MTQWQELFTMAELQSQLDGDDEDLHTLPVTGDWGYLLAVTGDYQYFSWFDSPQKMLRYLVQVEILHAPTSVPDQQHYHDLRTQLEAVVQDYQQSQNADALIARLNQIYPDFRLLWLGPLAELVSSETPFALRLRSEFQGHGEPVSESLLKPFAAFIEAYGS